MCVILTITVFPLIKNSKNAALEKYIYSIQTISEADIDFRDEKSINMIDLLLN